MHSLTDFSWVFSPQAWIALATLTLLEIILGIDNILFISILVARLPREQQAVARRAGLLLAMGMRIALLFSLAWITHLTHPLFEIPLPTREPFPVTGRSLILIFGGLFLLAKSTHEIYQKLEGDQESEAHARASVSFASTLIQIMLLDIVFSLDSVITAVGMADQIAVMIIAVVIAVGFMMVFAGAISRFVESRPTVKILALSFLLLIGLSLIAEGLETHIPKGYLYFSMAFSIFVDFLNQRFHRAKAAPVRLHQPYAPPSEQSAATAR